MAIPKKRSDFFDSEEGREIRRKLQAMAADTAFNTAATYSANGREHPDNTVSFVEKHMNYLNTHPQLEANKYLANIRLMTRIR